MRLLLLTATIYLMVSNIVHAQTNSVTDPGFESGSISLPWNISVVGDVNLDGTVGFLDISPFIRVLSSNGYQFEADCNEDGAVDFLDISAFIRLLQGTNSTLMITDDNSVEGDSAAVLDHGSELRSTGLSQLVTVVPGRSYLFSASVFFQDEVGDSYLSAQTPNGELLAGQAFPASLQIWEKTQVKFTAPSNVTSVRLFLRSEGSIGKTYFDAVKLFESGGGGIAGSNLIANEDFEDTGNWNRGPNAFYFPGEKRFGQRSLLLNAAGGISHATQSISLLGRGFSPDQPIYTLSAHIKTTGTAPAPETSQYWIEQGHQFPTVPGVGAALKVDFYNEDDTQLRTIYSPFFFSKADRFTERKFSFLPPKGTTKLVVMAMASEGDYVAFFDNVQLNAWEVPAGASQYVHNAGNTEVEAPEAGTYVSAALFPGLQEAVDSVTAIGSPDYGKLVWVGPGEYHHQHLLLKSTTHLKLHKDATLIKNSPSAGTSNWHGGHVKSMTFANAVTDVIVEGGTLDNHHNGKDYPGSAVAIMGDRVIVRNINIPRFSKTPDAQGEYFSSAIYLMGHHMYIYNNFVSGPKAILGHDGIHLWGGDHAHIMSNEVLAGDDGLGLFTGTTETFLTGELNGIFDRDISDVEAYNNIFDSVGSRCVAVGMARPRGDKRLTSSVSNIRIRNFSGVCGGTHPLLQVICFPGNNQPINSPLPDAQVRGILLENASLEGYQFPQKGVEDLEMHPGYFGGSLKGSPRLPPRGMRVITDDAGWVKDILFENISVRKFADFNNYSAAVDVFKAGSADLQQRNENIRFRFCTIGQLQTSGDNAKAAYRIVGLKGIEVEDLEDPIWGNAILSPGSKSFLED